MTAKLFNKMEDTCTTPEDMDKYVNENLNDLDKIEPIVIENEDFKEKITDSH